MINPNLMRYNTCRDIEEFKNAIHFIIIAYCHQRDTSTDVKIGTVNTPPL